MVKNYSQRPRLAAGAGIWKTSRPVTELG